MDIYQLKTFVVVAREGSITRASDLLFLSQPAVSAHIKALEEEIGFALFDRTTKGMVLTVNGKLLIEKAEQILALHGEMLADAARLKGKVNQQLRLGANRGAVSHLLGPFLAAITDALPDINLQLEFGSSVEIARSLATNRLDAGLYVEAGEPTPGIDTVAVDHFDVLLAAPPGWIADCDSPDWNTLAQLTWICPALNTCCGRAAEALFQQQGFRPRKQLDVDQESVTRTLITGGVGLGFLHTRSALDAEAKGEVQLVHAVKRNLSILLGVSQQRGSDPLLQTLREIAQRLPGYSHH